MAREIRLSEAARTDLIEIWTETSRRWSPDQANRYLDDIKVSLDGLIENPLIGTDCSDLLQGCRRLITGRHIAFYEVNGATIFVIRVLHQSMDVARHLRDR